MLLYNIFDMPKLMCFFLLQEPGPTHGNCILLIATLAARDWRNEAEFNNFVLSKSRDVDVAPIALQGMQRQA